MADIVERLRAYAADDHERGCQGREYTCSCGYDDKRDPLLTEAADTITVLRAEVERLISALSEAGTRNVYFIQDNNALRAENARLRAALEDIADCMGEDPHDYVAIGRFAPAIARAALGGQHD